MFPLLLAALIHSPEAKAYACMRVEEGPVFWGSNPWKSGPYIPLVGQEMNRSNVYPDELWESVVTAMQRWELASGGAFTWDYWQGSEFGAHPAGQRLDGVSSIHFQSADPEVTYWGPGVVAYTQIFFDPATREILEIDLALNDFDWIFTTDPAETTYVAGRTQRVALLQDVLSHELGHALGLDHSGVLQSTMFTWTWMDQAHLSCDDIAGIRTAFLAPGAHFPGTGGVEGAVRGPDGAPLFGAHVVALSGERRSVLGATMTDAEGRFSLRGLDPGTVHLMVEPFYAQAGNMSSGYADIRHRLCPNGEGELDTKLFSRTFYLDTDEFSLAPVSVYEGASSEVPPIEVGCGIDQAALVPGSDPAREQQFADLLFAGGDPPLTVVESVEPGPGWTWYRLEDIEGPLDIGVMSYSLYSPVFIELSLTDAEGDVVSEGVQELDPVLSDETTGYTLHDARLLADDLPKGDYFLRLEVNRLDPANYPRGDLYVDSGAFVVLSARQGGGSWYEGGGEWAPFDPDCAQDETLFEPYTSPAGAPRKRSVDPVDAEPAPNPLCACFQPYGSDTGSLGFLGIGVGWLLRRRKT